MVDTNPRDTDGGQGEPTGRLRFDGGSFEEPLAKGILLLEVGLLGASIFVGFWFLLLTAGSVASPDGTVTDEIGYLIVTLVLIGGAASLHTLWE